MRMMVVAFAKGSSRFTETARYALPAGYQHLPSGRGCLFHGTFCLYI